jgi:aspartate aminotransferase
LISKNKEVMAAAMKFAQARLSPPSIRTNRSRGALDTPQSYFDGVKTEYIARRDL